MTIEVSQDLHKLEEAVIKVKPLAVVGMEVKVRGSVMAIIVVLVIEKKLGNIKVKAIPDLTSKLAGHVEEGVQSKDGAAMKIVNLHYLNVGPLNTHLLLLLDVAVL